MKYVIITLFSIGLCSLPMNAEQDNVTLPEFVVVFSCKPDKPLTDPIVHIHTLVHAKSEGDASVAAFKYLQGFIRDEKLVFMEAQLKK